MPLLAAFVVLFATIQATDRLELPTRLADRAFSGEPHTFTLALLRNQTVMGHVEQKGVDLIVRIRDGRGAVVFEVDSPNGTDGPEPIAWIAPANGDYQLEIHPFEGSTGGAYDLVLESTRRATTRDRERAEALSTYLTAFRQRGEALNLQAHGQFARANALYKSARRGAVSALSMRSRHAGDDAIELVPIHQLLGLIDDEIGDFRSGVRHFARALELLEKAHGPDHPETVTTRSDLGHLRLAAGDYAGATTIFEWVVARREREGDQARTANALVALGESYLHRGQIERAETALRRAVSIRESMLGAEHRSTGHALISLGAILIRRGSIDEGTAICTRMADRLEKETAQSYHRAAVNGCLAEAALHRCELPEATRRAESMIRILEAAYGPNDPRSAAAHQLLGTVLAEAGDKSGARASFERALKIQRARLGDDHPSTAGTKEKLASVRQWRGCRIGADGKQEIRS